MAIPFLALTRYTTNALPVFLVTLGCAGIGFVDDFIKLHAQALARAPRPLEARAARRLITVGVGLRDPPPRTSTRRSTSRSSTASCRSRGPGTCSSSSIIAGAANGVNLTDGLDGLAAGTGIIAVFTFTAMAVIAWIRSGAPGPSRPEVDLDLAILGAALIGAIIGFLWYNAWPAEVFMGDTGSMAIGGALAASRSCSKVEFLLLLIGGIFLIEALSVMIQVFSFKRFGRRVFLMAPIHYHFEMKAWSETKIMVRFWILCAIFCALGFALYYRYYFQFFRGK